MFPKHADRMIELTLIRLFPQEQSDLDLHCLPRPVCPKNLGSLRYNYLSAMLPDNYIFIPPANFVCGGVYCFHVVRPSVRVSVRDTGFFLIS